MRREFIKKKLIAGIMAVTMMFSAAPIVESTLITAQASGWNDEIVTEGNIKTYYNERFNYWVSFPEYLKRYGTPVFNGDGATFKGKGIKITAEAAYPDQTFTLKVPEGVYSGKTIDSVTSDDSRAGYSSITGYDGEVTIWSANVQTKSKNAVFKVRTISGSYEDFNIKGEYSSSAGDAADNASKDNDYTYTVDVYGDGYDAGIGDYIYSNNLGKICIGNISFEKPGAYSVSLEDMTSGDHELITLNIDSSYSKDTDPATGDGKVSFAKDPIVEKVVADIGRDGTEVGTRIASDSSSDIKYVNGVYYLDYGGGSNTYILKFPLYDDNYGIRVYDWVHTEHEVSNIMIDPRDTSLEFSDNRFDSEKKLSDYVFSSDTPKKLKDNDGDDSPYYYTADKTDNSGSNAWEWYDADGMHSGSVNGILFRLSSPINGTVKLPVTFYGGDSFYNEIGKAEIAFSTDPAPSTENDHSDISTETVHDGNIYKISLDEDSVISYTVTPRDDYDGQWGALLYKGDASPDNDPSLFYSNETGEKSGSVILKAGDYTLAVVGVDDKNAKFDLAQQSTPIDMGSPYVKSVSTKKVSGNKVKYASVFIEENDDVTAGYRVKISKNKDMSGTILNTVKKVSDSGKVALNVTRKITGKNAYVTVTPYVSDFYGNKIWGDESDVKKISLPGTSAQKAPKGYYTYSDAKYGYTVYVPNWMKKSKKVSGGYIFKGRGIKMKLYGKNTSYSSVSTYVSTYYGEDARVSGNTYTFYDNMNDTIIADFGYWVKERTGAAIFCEVTVPPSKNYNDWKKVHTTVYNSIKKNTANNTMF